MIENEIVKLQVVSTVKLIVSAYLLFYWIPKKVLPQEYIDNPLDRIVFNIIHIVALITLVFPVFIYLKVFGFLFLILFFVLLRLLFLKYYYKKNLADHLRTAYLYLVTASLRILEKPGSYAHAIRKIFESRFTAFKSGLTFTSVFYWTVFSSIILYSLYIRVYRGYISLVGASPDMYQFYYWGNILKLNILFDKVAGAPYMWGGPVLVHTVNQFANLNTVVMYNIFPLLFVAFMFFSLFYVLWKLFEADGEKTASLFGALVLFGIVLPSPVSDIFFGLIQGTVHPNILKILPFSFYYPSLSDEVLTTPSVFFWRFTTTLPYEIASSFFLINLYFLIRYIQHKKTIVLLLYAESLAIIFAIHGGVAIPLLFPSMLIFAYSLITRELDLKSSVKLAGFVAAAAFIGNLWLIQILVYKFSVGLGAAAPLFEKLLRTGTSVKLPEPRSVLLILSPTPLLFALLTVSFGLIVSGVFMKKLRFPFACIGLISLGVLFIYSAPNLGLSRIVDHSRLMVFVAYAYALVSAALYYFLFEKLLLKSIFRKSSFYISLFLMFSFSTFTMAVTPRWIDNDLFWKNIHDIEYKEFPYLVYRIQDTFPPFSFTIVSYIQEFPQVISKGFHVNTQDFLQMYDPAESKVNFPSEYVFIFVENTPKEYEGLGEYWYRWRRDIMLNLKDWVAIYTLNHNNVKLWYRSQWVDAYIIDNRTYETRLLKQLKELKETDR